MVRFEIETEQSNNKQKKKTKKKTPKKSKKKKQEQNQEKRENYIRASVPRTSLYRRGLFRWSFSLHTEQNE